MRHLLFGALSWQPQIKGALYVLIAVVVLPGSAYLLLSTNVGSRLGFQLAAAGFFGWMFVLASIWWVYGTGPKGNEPTWKAQAVVTGDVAAGGRLATLQGFPHRWKRLDAADPEVADAQPVVDGKLVGNKARFKSSSDFLVAGAYDRGGERYGPLGLDFRPFNLFHKPHYLLIQVQPSIKPPAVAGQPPPKAVPDPQAQPVALVMVRDLGSKRLRPASVAVFSLIMFSLLIYLLHHRDKEATARRG